MSGDCDDGGALAVDGGKVKGNSSFLLGVCMGVISGTGGSTISW